MSSVGSAASTAVLQAADKATDKALADATRKLASDRQAKASDDAIRADQKAISAANKSASDIDAKLATATTGSSGSGAKSSSGVKLTA